MQKLLLLVLVSVLVSSLVARAQDVPTPTATYKNYKASLGILVNPKVIGAQGEVRLLKHFGGRLVATQVFDSHRQNEFSGGGIGLLTY